LHNTEFHPCFIAIMHPNNLKHNLYHFNSLSLAVLVNWKTSSSAIFSFPIQNTCILHDNTKCKSTSVSTHNFYSIIYNKRKLLNYSIRYNPNCCCNITIVRFICCWLQHEYAFHTKLHWRNELLGWTNPKSTNCYPQPNKPNLVSYDVLQFVD